MPRRSSHDLSTPGFLGLDGYVTGREDIEVERLNVPPELEDALWRYLTMAAISMVNTEGDPVEAAFRELPVEGEGRA